MNEELIDGLARRALNAACLEVQKELNAETRDVAGAFFSGSYEEDVLRQFKEYIRIELLYQEAA